MILLVEDNRADARIIVELIRDWPVGERLEVLHVETLAAALDALESQTPSCVLLDLALPDANGMEVVREIRRASPDVPLVVLTGRDDDALGSESLRCGAQDFLVKRNLEGRLLKRCLHQASERMRMESELRHMALYDPLTGLSNRILFLDRLEAGLARARRRGVPVAVMIMDLDRFKEVNDQLGHAAGDKVLRIVATLMQSTLRSEDVLARLGGDEFAILCEDAAEPDEICSIARRLLAAVAAPITLDEGESSVDASMGIAFAMMGEPSDVVLRNADRAMYVAKRRGHGELEIFAPDTNEAEPILT